MKMKVKRLGVLLFLAVVAVFAGESHAGSLSVTFNNSSTGVSPGQDVTIQLLGYNSNNQFNTRAGVFNWTQTSSTTNDLSTDSGALIDTFCIEVVQHINYGGSYVYETNELGVVSIPNPVGTYGPDQAMKEYLLNQLWKNNMTPANSASGPGSQFDGSTVGPARLTEQKAAAFQLAVWEIMHETNWANTNVGFDLTDGVFKAISGTNTTKAATITVANAMLAALDTDINNYDPNTFGSDWVLVTLTSGSPDNKQDQLTAVLSTDLNSSVPSPVAAGMGLIGFAMLGLRRQRETA